MNSGKKRDTRIPRRPLLWLAAALLFILPPLFDALGGVGARSSADHHFSEVLDGTARL